MSVAQRARVSEPPLTERLPEVAANYQRMLALNPSHPEALVGMSLVALASNQVEASIKMAQAAVAVAPTMGNAWVTLGQAFKAAGQRDEAERAYGEVILLDGMNALARVGLGELRLAAGKPEEALREYKLALQRHGAMASAHLGLGHALACLDRNIEALECYERALVFAPRAPEAEFAAAFVLARMGRTDEAEIRYRRVLVRNPDFAAAWMNLGCLLHEAGREAYAEAALRRAVELRPDMINGWLNLAKLKREQRLTSEAEEHLRRAFALDPELVETHISWSQYCLDQKDLPGAWEWLRWALARERETAESANMRGILLHAEERFEGAVEAFGRAEACGCKTAASNRGNSLMDLGRLDEALAAHEAAVACAPESAGARYNLALTQLRLGDWKHGWAGYEARWRFREVHRTPMVFRQPRWKGEPLEGRRILLHAEQGLGDAIQFCRYAPLVARCGGKVILQVHAAAERLIRSLGIVREGKAQVARLGEKPPEFDLECPLMSLPAVFGTTVDTVPWECPYLYADLDLADGGRSQREDADRFGVETLRVGIAWAGNPRYKADSRRSTNLATFVPLLRSSAVSWVSLQKGDAAEQLAHLPDGVALLDACSLDCDLAQTAAVIDRLDLVLTTDTCIAHLAGAMGKPVWILLPHLADWRWMENVETTPWYPTARLFRQSVAGDWAEVVERVKRELLFTCGER